MRLRQNRPHDVEPGAPVVRCLPVLAAAATLWMQGAAVAAGAFDACFVRIEPPAPAASAGAAAAPLHSHVGIRRKTQQLFDLDILVTAADQASCQVAGTAKLRGDAGSESLAMVVRPDPSRKGGRSGTLCQVFVRLSADGLTVATTPSSCQAQALCEGKVNLDGQRFEASTRLAANATGPCFARSGP